MQDGGACGGAMKEARWRSRRCAPPACWRCDAGGRDVCRARRAARVARAGRCRMRLPCADRLPQGRNAWLRPRVPSSHNDEAGTVPAILRTGTHMQPGWTKLGLRTTVPVWPPWLLPLDPARCRSSIDHAGSVACGLRTPCQRIGPVRRELRAGSHVSVNMRCPALRFAGRGVTTPPPASCACARSRGGTGAPAAFSSWC